MQRRVIPKLFLSGEINVTLGDITAQRVDAMVNAANATLLSKG